MFFECPDLDDLIGEKMYSSIDMYLGVVVAVQYEQNHYGRMYPLLILDTGRTIDASFLTIEK